MNTSRSFGYECGKKSTIFFNDLCKPMEIYIYARKKHPFTSYPAAKHPETSNLWLQTYDRNQLTFFTDAARAPTLAPARILRTEVFFAKVSVPVGSIIPCLYLYCMLSYELWFIIIFRVLKLVN